MKRLTLSCLLLASFVHCLSHSCVLHSGTGNYADIMLVPALYGVEHPSKPWMAKFDACVYQREKQNESNYVINRSYEAGVYLRYIVDNYNELRSTTVFVQQDAFEEIGNVVSLLKPHFGWAPLNRKFVSHRDPSEWSTHNTSYAVHACWHALASDFDVQISKVVYPVVSFYCCSYFAISDVQIRKHPLAVYVKAYERLVTSTRCTNEPLWNGHNAISDNDKDTGAGAFEHLQHALLGGQDLDMHEFTDSDWCLRFKPGAIHTTPSVCLPPASRIFTALVLWRLGLRVIAVGKNRRGTFHLRFQSIVCRSAEPPLL